MNPSRLRVLAFMEARTVTGPAKNLIEFATRAAEAQQDLPAVEMNVLTYVRDRQSNDFVNAVERAGIRVWRVEEKGRFDLQALTQIRQAVGSFQPDILQTHNIKSHLYIRWTGLHRHTPWIAFNHGYTAVDWKDRLYTQVDRWSLPGAFRVVALCGPFAGMLSARGVDRNRIRIQHNSVKPFVAPPAEEIEALRKKLEITNELVMLVVGRLSQEKGHADLVQAIGHLKERADVPPFCVVLVGAGPEENSIRQLAASLGVTGHFRLTGHQKDVRPYFALADLLALPSHSEGSPNVVLESMAAGVAVVATRVGGVPEIVTHLETGFIVPPRDPGAMAEALSKVLKEGALRAALGQAGEEHVRQQYTPEAYRRSLVTFYLDVLASYQAEAAR